MIFFKYNQLGNLNQSVATTSADDVVIQMKDLGLNKPDKCIEDCEETLAPIHPSREITDDEFSK